MKNLILTLLINLICIAGSVAQKKIPLAENLSLKECRISDYASSIKYTPLETTDECLLGDELQVIATSQFIFVHDYKEYKVYRFDINTGRYLNTIGKRGQGPGEYAKLQGFYVDEPEKKCFLLSNTGIYIYDFEGNYIKTISIPSPYFPTRMERIGNYYVLNNSLYPETKKELCLLDLQGKLVKEKALSDNSRIGFMIAMPFFYKQDGQCYYKNELTDDIYLLDEKLNMKPVYRIDCGKKATAPKDNQYDMNSGKNLVSEKILFGRINGYNDKLYIPYFVNNKSYMAVYDTKTGSVVTAGKNGESGFTDDLTSGPMVFLPANSSLYYSCVPGQLISWFYPSDIDVVKYQKGEFGKILKQIEDDGNPVIRIVNLK